MDEKGSPRWPTTSCGFLNSLRDRTNSAAWGRFEQQYGPIIRSFCLKRGLQHADADDVTQKVLLDFSRQIEDFQFQPERGRFRSWLATIAARAAWRVRYRHAAVEELSLENLSELEQPRDPGWQADFNAAILEVTLERIRGEFSDDEWTAFERNWRQDEPASVVAAAFNKSVTWMYQTKFKILRRLEEEVEILSADLLEFGA